MLVIPTSLISNFGYGMWWTGVDIGVNYGFPFNFYGYGGGPPQETEQPVPRYFHPQSLVGNIIFWLLISHISVMVFDRFYTPARAQDAGFGLLNSSRLQIVEGQRLLTDGVYGHIRHPLYLGEITRNLGFPILLSSLYGLVVMLVGNLFLLFRIEIEESMLLDEFGQEYEEYRKRTKKLIPHLY